MPVPKYDGLFNPLLTAMHELGGSASVAEQENKVTDLLQLTDKEASEIHRGNRTRLSYRLAWARNYLKRYGLLENSSRGIWSLTAEGHKVRHVDPKNVNRVVKSSDAAEPDGSISEETPVENRWQDIVLDSIKRISAKAFEI